MLQINKNKKGISEMISYVLLIVIAVGLSVLVFAYLKLYIPKGEKPECSPDISLSVLDYSCSLVNKTLNLTTENKGLFNIDAVYLRVGPEARKVRATLINDPIKNPKGFFINSITPCNGTGLPPGGIFNEQYTNEIFANSSINLTLEVEPATCTGKGRQLALCENAIITYPIVCK